MKVPYSKDYRMIVEALLDKARCICEHSRLFVYNYSRLNINKLFVLHYQFVNVCNCTLKYTHTTFANIVANIEP